MKSLLAMGLVIALASVLHASVTATVRGVVHDPQHRPVGGVNVVIAGANSDWKDTASTEDDGEFHFAAIPPGEYRVQVSASGFQAAEQSIVVTSSSSPVLHFQLAIQAANESVDVNETTIPEQSDTAMVSRETIETTPGATRANSLQMITAVAPGAYIVHNQLHIRGGHQVSWLVDGIPVPNTNIASNVGPQFDPKDIDFLEAQRGGYSAEFGDRTYGVFNVIPRNGFERNREGELTLNYGSYHSTDSQISLGDHSQTFAWYGSLSANRTDSGLQTPVPEILHDSNDGESAFGSLIWNRTPSDQVRFTTSLRNDFYQVPNDVAQQAAGALGTDRERDAFVNLAWVHTATPGVVFTLAPFYHRNYAGFAGRPYVSPDDPQSRQNVTDKRSSQYAGAVAMATVSEHAHNLRIGTQLFVQQDDSLFGLAALDGPALPPQHVRPAGNLEVLFAEDDYRPKGWLSLRGGVRLTRFAGGVHESSADPRLAASITLPRVRWVLHAAYGRYYQPPPLSTITGPLLEFAGNNDATFIPLKGERDEEREFGISMPFRGWSLDVTNFQTHARNFFDHDALGNSNIFFPLTIDRARIHGTEFMLISPHMKRAQLRLSFARQWVEGKGGVTGGLTSFEPPPDGYYFLDHDQRDTLTATGNFNLPWRSWVSLTWNYGSGFLNGDGPGHLGSHNTADASLGKSFGERWALGLTMINLGNHRFLVDNSNTFGGTHWSEPRQLIGEVKYRFKF